MLFQEFSDNIEEDFFLCIVVWNPKGNAAQSSYSVQYFPEESSSGTALPKKNLL